MKQLPAKPNLNYLAREAKSLKSQHRKGNVAVCKAIGHFDTSLHGLTDNEILETRFSILDAQRVVARQYGFASWTRLKSFVEACAAGLQPSDSTLLTLINERHSEIIVLQNEIRAKRGERKAKHAEYRKLTQDSTEFLSVAFEAHGWPGPAVIGRKGVEALYLITANAVYDAEFQKKALELMTNVMPAGAFWEYSYASLKDRYLKLTMKPSVYGIPFGSYIDDSGCFQLFVDEIVDPDNLDKRRASAGYESYQAQHEMLAKMALDEKWELRTLQEEVSAFHKLTVEGGYTSLTQ